MIKEVHKTSSVTIRFVGDSGDGMQLTGSQFTQTSAVFGNDVCTLPDFPAEIRAPAGSLAGVSGFQLNFSSREILTPGDEVDVLVAMNPAAFRTNIDALRRGGLLIANRDAFTEANLRKAGYADGSPLDAQDLSEKYKVHSLPLTSLNRQALEGIEGMSTKEADRCKNFFALGVMFWLYERSMDTTLKWIHEKFGKRPEIAEANTRALRAGYHYGETAEIFQGTYKVPPARLAPGTYRTISGNEAAALGFVTAARLAGKPLVYGSYPITPASDILHELARHRNLDVRTFQAEDEIAAIGAAIGASFGGALGLTGTSGPGVALKGEAINLAIMLELPLVIANIQRGGPSTGLPTKTEQSDLLQAMYGRNGESPIAILAARSPADCFLTAIEAFRIAVRYMTPVFFLSDGYIANGAEPWRIPRLADLESIEISHDHDPAHFLPYARDEATLARPWALPGTRGLEHRIGGLEKADLTGNVCYDPVNHEKMCRLRAEKIARIAQDLPPTEVHGAPQARVLAVGWGSTFGAIRTAVDTLVERGEPVAHVHLRHLNPFPTDLGEILKRHDRVIVPELNFGQLSILLRARYLVDAVSLGKVRGQPFLTSEVVRGIESLL